jgi:hypothetical protein
VAAKSTSDASKARPFPPNPNSSQSTISTVEREIREAGGEATAVAVDARDFSSVQRMVEKTIEVRRGARSRSHVPGPLPEQGCQPPTPRDPLTDQTPRYTAA